MIFLLYISRPLKIICRPMYTFLHVFVVNEYDMVAYAAIGVTIASCICKLHPKLSSKYHCTCIQVYIDTKHVNA